MWEYIITTWFMTGRKKNEENQNLAACCRRSFVFGCPADWHVRTLYSAEFTLEIFWWLLIAAFAVFLVVRRIALGFRDFGRQTVTKRTKKGKRYKYRRFNVNFKPYLVLVGVICLYFLLSVSGSSVFNASKYSSILTVSEADFSKDISESVGTDSIALMDTASARMLGDREIGSLSSVVSQFNVSDAD